jgi:hypothetical protein
MQKQFPDGTVIFQGGCRTFFRNFLRIESEKIETLPFAGVFQGKIRGK